MRLFLRPIGLGLLGMLARIGSPEAQMTAPNPYQGAAWGELPTGQDLGRHQRCLDRPGRSADLGGRAMWRQPLRRQPRRPDPAL